MLNKLIVKKKIEAILIAAFSNILLYSDIVSHLEYNTTQWKGKTQFLSSIIFLPLFNCLYVLHRKSLHLGLHDGSQASFHSKVNLDVMRRFQTAVESLLEIV